MSLSRKHYQAVAEILKTERQTAQEHEEGASLTQRSYLDTCQTQIDRLEDRLCAYFQSDNPNFRPDTFRKAAQP